MRYLLAFLLLAGMAHAQARNQYSPPKDIVQMPSDLLGEPLRLEQMRIGDSYQLPADCLILDSAAKCWLDPSQPIKFKRNSDHLITVKRFKDNAKHTIGYRVEIDAKRLQGWRWRLGTSPSSHMMARKFIPVISLSYTR